MDTVTSIPLLDRIKVYSFPGGEDAARTILRIKTAQRGELRSGPNARWVPFSAHEWVDATRSGFCWDARMGTGLLSVQVTDAYENGHGRLVVRKGPLKLKELTGPEVDKGELQRYLAYLNYCPPILLNNRWLEFSLTAPDSLRVRDRLDVTGASVDFDVDAGGRIITARTVRPMTVGKSVIPTPWSATVTELQECEGLRVPRRMEAAWQPEDGAAFTYVWMELTTCEVLRWSELPPRP